ncbi:MAG: NADPH-dependent oxidoreductase [Hymenobacter sp.]|nr:MAG: NADPH-dependent oxidoreductase [Hymenobacter sp.]
MAALPLVLLASARPVGHTFALVQRVFTPSECVVTDLLAAPLAPYNYAGQYPPGDAFASLVQQLLAHETIVLATPVYWYAMSGLLKTFFDRLTDLTTFDKPLGRQLRGKRLFALCTGTDAALPPGFEVPFQRTARYFNMIVGNSLYYSQKYPLPAAEWLAARDAFRTLLLPFSPSPFDRPDSGR